MKIMFEPTTCVFSECYNNLIIDNTGFEKVYKVEDADIVIYEGCAYTRDRMLQKLDALIEILNKKSDNTHLIISGCFTNYNPVYEFLMNEFENEKKIHIIKGYGMEFAKNVVNCIKSIIEVDSIEDYKAGYDFETPFRLKIPIADGCLNRCAFCKTNCLNMELHSRGFEDIISTVKEGVKYGVTEIKLTGLNTTQYGLDLYHKKRLHELIQEVSKIDDVENIMLDMMSLQDMYPELIEEIVTNHKISRIMLPIQANSDHLLQNMNIKQSAKERKEIIKYIRDGRPDLFIETIFMVWYPTETTKDILLNYQFLQDINIDNSIISYYNGYGYNFETLKSEQLPRFSEKCEEKHLELYLETLFALIEERKKEMLKKKVIGRVISEGDTHFLVSTMYRLFSNDIFVLVPKGEYYGNLKIGDYVEIEITKFPKLEENQTYFLSAEYSEGNIIRVLNLEQSNKGNKTV